MHSNKVKDFLRDDNFICYILDSVPDVNSPYEAFFKEGARNKIYAEEARAILLAPADVECLFSEEECLNIKVEIISTIKGLGKV